VTAAAKNAWFAVDKEGLGKLVERRGKAFVIFELVQNAWDCAGTKQVDVSLTWLGRDRAELTVVDDHPDGFKDLAHAYTLFAPSEKKRDPNRRGRFNLGEKLVLAICDRASVTSTKGQVLFDRDGSRRAGRGRTEQGSVFHATVKMTGEEFKDVALQACKLLPPTGVVTMYNGVEITAVEPLRVIEDAFLSTEISDGTGVLRRRYAHTEVALYLRAAGEQAMLYEMGIPVVELGDDPFHVDVRQKIPLTMERDGVPPGYLRDIRGVVLDGAHDLISAAGMVGKWTQDAIEESSNKEAVRAVITKRYGEKVVISDPSDQEGTKIAHSRGYTVIPGGSFTGDAWDKIKDAAAALPAGQVTPSPKPFHPDGNPLEYVPHDELTERENALLVLTNEFAHDAAGLDVSVLFTRTPGWDFRAAYSKATNEEQSGTITFNLAKLGEDFWDDPAKQFELIVHELGHHFGGHLDAGYHEALCRIAGKAIALCDQTLGRRGWSRR
jgi:hypothetical protein